VTKLFVRFAAGTRKREVCYRSGCRMSHPLAIPDLLGSATQEDYQTSVRVMPNSVLVSDACAAARRTSFNGAQRRCWAVVLIA